MSDPTEARLLELLQRYVSELNAGVMLSRARKTLGRAVLARADVPGIRGAIAASTRLFLSADDLAALQRELAALEQPAKPRAPSPAPSPEPVKPASLGSDARTVFIASEADVRVARLAARELCQRLGASSLVQQKFTTVVEELAGNIASHTPGGELTLKPLTEGAEPRLRVVATDRGKGIANVAEVLSGQHKSSRPGQARGLFGLKQLMERFDVRTGPSGTRVEAESSLL